MYIFGKTITYLNSLRNEKNFVSCVPLRISSPRDRHAGNSFIGHINIVEKEKILFSV